MHIGICDTFTQHIVLIHPYSVHIQDEFGQLVRQLEIDRNIQTDKQKNKFTESGAITNAKCSNATNLNKRKLKFIEKKTVVAKKIKMKL